MVALCLETVHDEWDLDLAEIRMIVNKIVDAVYAAKFDMDLIDGWVYALLLIEKIIKANL